MMGTRTSYSAEKGVVFLSRIVGNLLHDDLRGLQSAVAMTGFHDVQTTSEAALLAAIDAEVALTDCVGSAFSDALNGCWQFVALKEQLEVVEFEPSMAR